MASQLTGRSSPSDPTRTFPLYRFSGSHRQIGRNYGEACGGLIKQHLNLALHRLVSRYGATHGDALRAVLSYRPYVVRYAPFLDEEIQGVAEGADISLAEAYLLQLRAELYRYDFSQHGDEGDECTTFAVLAEATSDGTAVIGQNADLPDLYSALGVVVEIVAEGKPAVLMLTPAGQVSYIGINNQGMGVFGNYLTCDGWRLGFPRYLLSRLALLHKSVEDATAAIHTLYRASSRNLIMLDRQNRAVDLETTPTREVHLEPENGLLAHANHYVAPDLLAEERALEKYRLNSQVRLERIHELLEAHRGRLNASCMKMILRDRDSFPYPLCRMPGDDPESDAITFASVIAEPSRGQFWAAVGPPNEYEYKLYAFSSTGQGR